MTENSILSLVVDPSGVAKGVGTATSSLNGLIAAASKATAIVAGVVAALGTAYKAVEAYAESEAATSRLTAALAKNGESAADIVPVLQEYAGELQKLTIYGDDFTVSQMAMLRNMGVQTSQLKAATKAAMGLAAAYDLDLATAIHLVSKASVGETAMLKRHGIIIDDIGTDQEKFNALLALGAENFQQAEAAAATFSGRLTQMWNALSDALEPFGLLIMDGLNLRDVLNMTTGLIMEFTRQAAIVVPEILNLTASVFGLTGGLQDVTNWLRTYIIPYMGKGLVLAIGAALNVINTMRFEWNKMTILMRTGILVVVEAIDLWLWSFIKIAKQFEATRGFAEQLEAGIDGFKDTLKTDIVEDANDIAKSISGIAQVATYTGEVLARDLAKPLDGLGGKDLPGGMMPSGISKPQEAKFAGLAMQGSVEAYKAEIARTGSDEQIASNTAQTAQNTARIARALERQIAEEFSLGTT